MVTIHLDFDFATREWVATSPNLPNLSARHSDMGDARELAEKALAREFGVRALDCMTCAIRTSMTIPRDLPELM